VPLFDADERSFYAWRWGGPSRVPTAMLRQAKGREADRNDVASENRSQEATAQSNDFEILVVENDSFFPAQRNGGNRFPAARFHRAKCYLRRRQAVVVFGCKFEDSVRKALLLILLSMVALPGCGVLSIHSPWPFVDAPVSRPHSAASAIASSTAPTSSVGG
jgi:hypothetical protein